MTHPDLALLRAHLNLDPDFTADDALLAHKLAVAEEWCRSYLGSGIETAPAVIVTEARLQLAAFWYAQREASSFGVSISAIPYGVESLLRPHREEVTGRAAS